MVLLRHFACHAHTDHARNSGARASRQRGGGKSPLKWLPKPKRHANPGKWRYRSAKRNPGHAKANPRKAVSRDLVGAEP